MEPTEPKGRAAMIVTLAVTAGPHQGAVFSFAEHDTFLVGRSKRAHFQLKDKDRYFSRLHFMTEVNPPFCRLTDLKSHNGTFVNSRRVKTADLRDGDEIKAGHTFLRVALTGPDPAATVAFPGPPKLPTGAAGRPQPSAVPGYRVMRELGRGGMGVVYLAERETDGTLVALKTVISAVAGSRNQIDRFLREADILRQLVHPNIVAFHEMGEANGTLFFVMEYVNGPDAGRILKARGPLTVRAAVRLVCQLLQALEHAHAQGFVHRDIKPSNLVAGVAGGKKTVKLADFGLARVYQASQLSGLTLQGDVGGTMAFMPPEQLMHFRDVKPAADQYSTAATLYTLLTGKALRGDGVDPIAVMKKILEEEPAPIRDQRPELPDELAAVIHKALAREPARRFADVGELNKALRPFAR